MLSCAPCSCMIRSCTSIRLSTSEHAFACISLSSAASVSLSRGICDISSCSAKTSFANTASLFAGACTGWMSFKYAARCASTAACRPAAAAPGAPTLWIWIFMLLATGASRSAAFRRRIAGIFAAMDAFVA